MGDVVACAVVQISRLSRIPSQNNGKFSSEVIRNV